MKEETIAAIATPAAIGGVSMIRVSGEDAISVAEKVFRGVSGKPLSEYRGYHAAYGEVSDSQGTFDNAVALVFRAPKSYTGENVVELSCHGGLSVTRRLLRAILHSGARLAEPGEFTKRAFLNGRLSLTQAESVMDLIHSQNDRAMVQAKAVHDGALHQRITAMKEELLAQTAHITALIDFPEEDVDEVERESLSGALKDCERKLRGLVETFDVGRVLQAGVNTVIIGRPNVGKSTLMNRLAGMEKSIVTEIAGTTRDVVEETVNLGDVVLRLADTAGIRNTEDRVEAVGVERARKRLEQADLVLFLLDASSPLDKEDLELIDAVQQKPAVVLLNKSDLGVNVDLEYIQSKFKHAVVTSLAEQFDVAELNNLVCKLLGLDKLDSSQPLIANERQRDCALRALQQVQAAEEETAMGMTLDAVDLCIRDAVAALMELTGESVSEVIVDEVFSRFCVGK